MFRATNSPILRSSFWLYIQPLVQCTDTAADRCIIPKAVYTVKKWSWGWANLSPETCRAELKKINKRKSCCISSVVYIVLVMHAHTNDKHQDKHRVIWEARNLLTRRVTIRFLLTPLLCANGSLTYGCDGAYWIVSVRVGPSGEIFGTR